MSFWTKKQPVAKKPHRCDSCGKGIAIGEKYTARSGMFEGGFFSAKHCPSCATGYEAYSAYMNDTTRPNYRHACSDEWLSFDAFDQEAIDWIDWFSVAEIEADRNLRAMVAAMPRLIKWVEVMRQKEKENAA